MTYTIIFTNPLKILCKLMFYLYVCLSEYLHDNNQNLINGGLEQSTDNNLINFLTTAKLDDFSEENIISENEDISEIHFLENIMEKTTQNGTYFIIYV